MVEVNSKERFLDLGARKKFGIAWEYGQKIYGQIHYGIEEEEWDYNEYGFKTYGSTEYGADDKRWGIYQKRKESGRVFFVRQDFYIPNNPQTGPQQAWRQVFTDGMTAWAVLTDAEKKGYNEKGSKLGMKGYNFFMREYLNSH